MAKYTDDRSFTDFVHKNIAVSKIYNEIGWVQEVLEEKYAEKIDRENGIDYIFKKDGIIKTVQERFRERKFQKYSDFTIRYRRDGNIHEARRESEYYKMKAAFFTYGITNCLKTDIAECTDFIKYAIIDMEKVYSKIDSGEIRIKDNGANFCKVIIENNQKIIECPVKFNKDQSSSFFPIEISYLIDLFGENIVIAQKGFL
ncbi:hypothetical protein [Frigoriflavimonas asaccharolytica]|uniref:Uncharacterized protein n=1 Tax=Frigoriflavimonas asaccharolytica TaxID=2735899 RepID=A0A8J8G736_9FLAO|nr:hypothetical protein [Frigoriflavimonas asaccharolytica]NRS92713.1 hypothetical protein [Frigoriflavimonas asaccharolytica]